MTEEQQQVIPEWKSYGSEKEILVERIKNNRDYLINIRFYKKRKYFGKKLQSRKVDTIDTFRFFPSFKDPRFVEMRKERDFGVQWAVETREQAIQTPWYRKVNNTVQVSIASPLSAEEIAPDSCVSDNRLLEFLNRVEPEMSSSLEQNANIDIFRDDFAELFLDDIFIDRKSESQLKEHVSLSNSEFAKEKKVTSIHWQPKAKGIVAFGSIDSRSVDKRFCKDVDSENDWSFQQPCYVVVWDFNDPIWPQIVLEAPYDVYCIEFNPTDPKILVGGLVNGQVVIWDLSEAEKPDQKEIGMNGEEKASSHIKTLPWKQMSLLEASHDGPVYAIHWIANKVFNDFGELMPSSSTNQFLTISSDGKLLVWDKDMDFVLPSKKAAKMKSEKLRGKWTPVNTWNVWTENAASPLTICSMHYVSNYNIYFGTQDGEFVVADFSPIERKSAMLDEERGVYKTFNTQNISKNVAKKHFSEVHTVQAHPYFPDIIVTISIFEIHIWKLGCKSPIWSSPFRDLNLTCGVWSPTRASVLFIGRHDGVIEIWDFLDKSHVPCVENVIYQNVELTCMEFLKTKSKYAQYVAIGSNQGFLHILEVPRNLVKPIPDENLHIQSFFNREEEKVRYFERRFEYHKQNSEELKKEQAIKNAMGIDIDIQDSQHENEVKLNQERNLEKMFKDIITRDPASLLDY